ncbi:unnamed protein product [Parnassius mnemosyne]|uniref:Envelope protein n=1 Tax=Parnassius mnemosyne TaxID=213953 RepID=A0AAV1MBP8_9NEOP
MQLRGFVECNDIISPIEVLLNSNFAKVESLSYIVSTEKQTRHKRALEFGGEFLKFFFGTLDADDARKYDAAISACQNSESELLKLMKDNIHIIQSSINVFNSTIYKLNMNENKLNSQINSLNIVLSQIVKNNDQLSHISKIYALLNIIESSLATISNFLDNVLNSILFSKRLDFPIPLTVENIHTLIDISKLTSFYYNQRIIFILRIPLISSLRFTLYKCIPLPTPHNPSNPNSFALIQATKPYLGITEDRLSYSLLDNLNDCNIISNDYSICPLISIFSTIKNPSCETKLLTEVTLSLPSQCNSKLLYGQIDVWYKISNNKFIYVQSEKCKLTIKCNNIIQDFTILGTCILSLNESCIGFSKTIQLSPSTIKSIKIENKMNLNFNIIEDDCCNKEVLNKSIPYLSPISLTSLDMDALKYSYHSLNNLESEINKVQEQSHIIKYGNYYSSFTYFLIICFILYVSYKMFCYFIKRNNDSCCCIQIFNQCNTRRIVKHKSKVSNSIELSEVSSSDDDKKDSISLSNMPVQNQMKRTFGKFNLSNRNLCNN